MAQIVSFRGYRFNPRKIEDLNQVVTQPYDKIDEELRGEYLLRNEFNIVNIIKGLPRPNDTPNDNVYTRANDFWTQWIEDRVLIREPGPAIYPYTQEYEVDGETFARKGLVALVNLDDKGAKVRAHEKTLSGPKADRLKLMRATEANDGQIFMLYNDAENSINGMIDQDLIGVNPIMEVKDDFGAIHRLYRLSRPGLILDIAEIFADKDLFIADGHHRFETAVNYKNECKQRNWKPVGSETFTHRMVTLVNMHDPGLKILPTHRLIHSLEGFDADDFLRRTADDFDIAEFTDRSVLFESLETARKAGKTAFGFAAEGMEGFRLITLKDPAVMDKIVTDEHSDAWKRLDVTVLHEALLDRILGIDAEKLAAESNVTYKRNRLEALDLVGKDGNQALFLMNSTRTDQVSEIASAGERMPQKSTDFFPKLLTGMVMMKMNIDKSMGLATWVADHY